MTPSELTKFVLDKIEDGGWVMPAEHEQRIEDYAKETVDALIADRPELKHVDVRDVIVPSQKEARSETPLLDMCRHKNAIVTGNRELQLEIEQKDNYGTTTAGGYLVPTENASEVIDLVYKDAAVASVLRRVPMATSTILFPSLTAGTSAYTVAEASDAAAGTGAMTESNVTTGQITLTAYKHGVFTAVSKELLADSNPSFEALIREDIARQIGSYFDWGVFHGTGTAGVDGTASSVTGLESLITSNVLNAGGAPSFDDINGLRVFNNNTPMPGQLFMHPAAERALMGVKDNNGRYIYDPTVRSGDVPTVWGMPVHISNRISTTLGGGAETAIFAGAFSSSGLMGARAEMEVTVDPYSYAESHAIKLVVIMRIGFQVTAQNHFAILGGVTL